MSKKSTRLVRSPEKGETRIAPKLALTPEIQVSHVQLPKINQNIANSRKKLRNFFIQGIAVFIIMLFMSFLLWIKFFDYVYLDTLVEHLTIGLGDVAPKIPLIGPLFPEKNPFNSAITLVSINKATEDKFGPLDPSWRQYHAVLVDRLSQAGAKVIMFDLTFGAPGKNEFNQLFIDAIKEAKAPSEHTSRKTDVIVGFKDIDENTGTPKLVEGLRQVVSGYGVTCIGSKLGGYGRSVVLAIKKKSKSKSSFFPSLALKTYEVYHGLTEYDYALDEEQQQIISSNLTLKFSEVVTEGDSTGCPIIQENDIVMDRLIDFSPLQSVLRNPVRRHAYQDVVAKDADSETLRQQFANKIVIVGRESPNDVIFVSRRPKDEARYGFEIHADALNTLLNGTVIRSLSYWWQLFLMFALGLIALYLQSRRNWYQRFIVFSLAVGIYFIVILSLYTRFHVLLYPCYDSGMFLVTYWISGKMKRNSPQRSMPG